MPAKEIRTAPQWSHAVAHLVAADATLAAIIARVGPCLLAGRRDYFTALCKAIYGQQLSTKVAAVLFGRFCNEFSRKRPTPAGLLTLFKDPETIKRCGLSKQKAAYLQDLAQHFADGRIPTRKLVSMSDEEIIEALVAVHGVGRWTAEMFLMFVLNRPDVLPVDDLGLREAARRAYKLRGRPSSARLKKLAQPWKPFRSIATWYLWRSLNLKD